MKYNTQSDPRVSEEPTIIEAPLGTREYWFEHFRRVVAILDTSDCLLVSIDVHKVYNSPDDIGFSMSAIIEDGTIGVIYYTIPVETIPELNGVRAEKAELVVVKTATGRLEASDVRIYYCGIRVFPGYQDVYGVYRRVVEMIEGRDPEKNPLKPPELVRRVYESRGLL